MVSRSNSGLKSNMKKSNRKIGHLTGLLLALSLLNLGTFSVPTFAANESLVADSAFPTSIGADVEIAKFPLSLPTSVTLGTSTNVKWSITNFTFKDNIGADFDYAGHVRGLGTMPFNVTIDSLGRQATFNVRFVYSTNTTISFNANVDGKDYSLTKNVTWMPSAKYGGRVSPTTSSDFGFETKVPEPGNDAQVTIQVRAVGNNTWATDDIGIRHKIQFDLVDSNGQLVQNGTFPDIGTWQNFTINGAQYQKVGLALKASWAQCYPTNCYGPGVYFSKIIPLNINFPKPSHSIDLTCEEVFREKLSKCSFTINSKGLDGTATELGKSGTLSISILKIDGTKTQSSKSFTFGQSADFQLPADRNSLTVVIALDGESLSKQVVVPAHTYSLAEQVSITWNLTCVQSSQYINCKASPVVTPNPNFEKPNSIPYLVNVTTYSKNSQILENSDIKQGTISPNQAINFSVANSTLLESIKLGIDESNLDATWTNKSYAEPLGSNNLTLTLACPENFSGTSFKCTVSASSTTKSSTLLKIELQYKTNKVNWKNLKTSNLKVGASSKISVPNLIDDKLFIRVLTKVNGTTLYSNSPNWIVSTPASSSNSNSDVRVAAIRSGLKEGCSRLPSTLNIKYVGPGPSSGGNPSRTYSVNGIFNVIIYDLGDSWNFGAYPLFGQNQDTAALWNCGSGGKGAVLRMYFVDK